jgi:hypothetical protein
MKIYVIVLAFIFPIIVYVLAKKIKRGIALHCIAFGLASIYLALITGAIMIASYAISISIGFVVFMGGYGIMTYDCIKIGKRLESAK